MHPVLANFDFPALFPVVLLEFQIPDSCLAHDETSNIMPFIINSITAVCDLIYITYLFHMSVVFKQKVKETSRQIMTLRGILASCVSLVLVFGSKN